MSKSKEPVPSLEEFVFSLRALAMTMKDSTPLDDLLKDYASFEGHNVKATNYGYKTMEELVKASKEFLVTHKSDKVYIAARPNQNTAHITKMVMRQKGTQRRPQKFYDSSQAAHCSTFKRSTLKAKSGRAAPPPASLGSSDSHPNSFLSSEGDDTDVGRKKSARYHPFANARRPQRNVKVPPCSTYTSFVGNFPEPIRNYCLFESAISLEVFCSILGVPAPSYNIYTLPRCPGYFCAIFVGGRQYTTEPISYETPVRAKVECAAIANYMMECEPLFRSYPPEQYCNKVLARKLFHAIENYPAGISCKTMPALFKFTYGQTLPEHWLMLVKGSPMFRLALTCFGDVVVYPSYPLC